jgi:hypothetical protein
MWMWMWRLCQGRPEFACLPRGHSTAIHSQRMPLPLPSPTIHTRLNPCPCLFLVAVRHVSLSLACSPPIRCTFLRALDARGPKGRVRDNTLLSLVQPPLFPATLWPPPRPAQPSTTSTTSNPSNPSTQNIPHPIQTTQSPSWSEPAQHIR